MDNKILSKLVKRINELINSENKNYKEKYNANFEWHFIIRGEIIRNVEGFEFEKEDDRLIIHSNNDIHIIKNPEVEDIQNDFILGTIMYDIINDEHD
jgi:hypothetical protein